MRIERVIVRGLRALRMRDDRLIGPGGARRAICLRGLNGSGKTTYLEALAELWRWFRRCVQARGFAEPDGRALLGEAELVAALFTGLPGPRPRMWIAWGHADVMRDALEAEPDSPYSFQGDRVRWDAEVITWWEEAFTSAETGLESPKITPNFVWIQAENKYVPELRASELLTPRSAPAYAAVARYLPSSRGPSHLEGLLRTLSLARRERWKALADALAELRPGLSLLDRFDDATLRPLFQLSTGEILSVDRLSAGERSLLINLAMILRWISPGGVVLLDEPELHQHLTLMRGSLAVIEALIASPDIDGQLFVASHAPEVWDHFRRHDAILDLGEPSP
jgi:AAA domain, putative AbiEii toxin, Type IV TA system